MIQQKRMLTSSRLQKSLKRKTMRRRLIRVSLVVANVIVLGVVASFVIFGSHGNTASGVSTLNENAANPVDGQTSYDIAANVAHMTKLPESTAISNQAQSAQVAVAVSASNTSVVAKPQIVATSLKSRDDIQTYVAQAGDTVASIAQKYGITTDSLMWSNGISGQGIPLGTKLVIPPINGIVYTVKGGDTIDSLATKFSANSAQITAYNDAEISGISTGEQILIPNGQIAQQRATATVTSGGGNFLAGGSFTPLYGDNGYDYGYCTWYVASQIPVPSNWGNAATWAYYAALSGWTVSSVPKVGAIAQTSVGYAGHVAIVTSVNDDGTVTISEMNGPAGWGRIDSRTTPVGDFPHYIYH
jgi:surface antigen